MTRSSIRVGTGSPGVNSVAQNSSAGMRSGLVPAGRRKFPRITSGSMTTLQLTSIGFSRLRRIGRLCHHASIDGLKDDERTSWLEALAPFSRGFFHLAPSLRLKFFV